MPGNATRAGPPPPGEPARHVVQQPTKPTEPCSRAHTVARDADRAARQQEPGFRSPSRPAPARPAKDNAVRAESRTRCDCSTYCSGCELWPFRAALSGTWRALEALAPAA